MAQLFSALQTFTRSFLGAVDLIGQPSRSIDTSVGRVVEVRRRNVESATADRITSVAVHLRLRCRKIGNAAVVLLILGVAEENDTLDLVLDGGADFGYGVGHDGSALAIDGE